MAVEFRMMETRVLYNLMHQVRGAGQVPMRTQTNFLLLVDARQAKNYEREHIVGAIRPRNLTVFPGTINISTVQHCVVYDIQSTTPLPGSEAHTMAEELAKYRTDPVYILKGGISQFTKDYLFLRSSKVLYTPRELEELQIWPLDLYDHLLFIGCREDARSAAVIKDMQFRAVVLLDTTDDKDFACQDVASENFLRVRVAIDEEGDLLDSFKTVVTFIEKYVKHSLRVLLVSSKGRMIKAIFSIAYLISKSFTLKESHDRLTSMDPSCRPGKTALMSLFEWEILQRKERGEVGSEDAGTEFKELLPYS